jgi:hypothetical protein
MWKTEEGLAAIRLHAESSSLGRTPVLPCLLRMLSGGRTKMRPSTEAPPYRTRGQENFLSGAVFGGAG